MSSHPGRDYKPQEGDTIIGEAGGVTFGVYHWWAGNTRLHTAYGYHPTGGCSWGANRKGRNQAIADATVEHRRAFHASLNTPAPVQPPLPAVPPPPVIEETVKPPTRAEQVRHDLPPTAPGIVRIDGEEWERWFDKEGKEHLSWPPGWRPAYNGRP